jgi:hypothetical protein
MTPEELDSIGEVFINNYDSIPLGVKNENATIVAAIATIVEILRKDLKEMENREVTRRLHERYFGERRIV